LNIILIVAVFLAALILSQYVLNQQYKWKLTKAKNQSEAAKVQLSRLQTQQLNLAKEHDALSKKKSLLDAKLEYLKLAKRDKPGELSQALVYLPTLIPDEIWINKLLVSRDGVAINGSTLNNQAISKFMDSLNRSNKFKGSNFNFTKKSEIGDATLYNFEIATNLAE
ncbi:MAG: PilN domain-containing protein, partial [Candidatus Omnitrophota bacterium]|nr:PilN domain-containing protein [Candidatus Omnitrophota bacterium]